MGEKRVRFIFISFICLILFNPSFGESGPRADRNDKIILTADEQIFNLKTNQLTAKGRVRIKKGELTVSCQQAFLNSGTQEVIVSGGVELIQGKVKLTCQKAKVSLDKEEVKAEGKVVFTSENLTLSSGELRFNNQTKYVLATLSPEAHFLREGKTTTLTALQIETILEEEKAIAKGEVKITRENTQASCDLLTLYNNEQKAELVGNARATQGENKLSGEKIIIFFQEQRMIAKGETKVIVIPREKGEEGEKKTKRQ